MDKSTLHLFNAIHVEDKKEAEDILLEKTLPYGFVLSPRAASVATDELIEQIAEFVGISGEKANNAFHKSWKTIKDTPQEALWIQASVHYMTVYGFEELGIYNKDTVYIPSEELDIPDVNEDIKLVVIHAFSKDELLEKIIEIGSGIALNADTMKHVMSIVEDGYYDNSFVDSIKNRELKSMLYAFYGIVPSEPVEFLRYVVNKLTEETLLIKNDYLIEKIKECTTRLHQRTLDELLQQAPSDLPSIFLRYKPIFLALKSVSKNKTFFNRLRKKADAMHRPLKEDYLGAITQKLKAGKEIELTTLKKELDRASIFRKIRLAYALKFRMGNGDALVYRIRNGRAWATTCKDNPRGAAYKKKVQRVFGEVVKSIEKDLDVRGKTIYIPENVNYAFPATEKQFTGNFPSGSYVEVPNDMVVGIHWEDTENRRVDLDLSVVTESGKVGWDSSYKSEDEKVLFSGDLTAAPKPNGAAELFYIGRANEEAKLLTVNYYNFAKGYDVDAKILVAHEKADKLDKNYVIDVNSMVATANINISKKQNILGVIVNVDGQIRFYFSSMAVGNSITASSNENATNTREYLVNSCLNSIDFKDVLEGAGAKIVSNKPEDDFIDLSPESLDKNTIINLITKDV